MNTPIRTFASFLGSLILFGSMLEAQQQVQTKVYDGNVSIKNRRSCHLR